MVFQTQTQMQIQTQIHSIKELLSTIPNDIQWNNLKNNLKIYENHLLKQLNQLNNSNQLNNNSNYLNINDSNDRNDRNDRNDTRRPIKPPLKNNQNKKQLLLPKSPLLYLLIRLPNNKQSKEIIIWKNDNNEIEKCVNQFCNKNNLNYYKQQIKKTIINLLK